MRHVGQEQPDTVTLTDALVLQTLRHTPHRIRHFGVAVFAPHEVGERRPAHAFGRGKKHVVKRHGGELLVPLSRMQIVGCPRRHRISL